MIRTYDYLRESRFHDRLQQETRSESLEFLRYEFVPRKGLERFLLTVGRAPKPSYELRVQSRDTDLGTAELAWLATDPYTEGQASALLTVLDDARGFPHPPAISEHLHDTVCQSLTAAHLHLELGLLQEPQVGEEFFVAQQLVQRATTEVRDLIDTLRTASGEPG